MCKTDTAHIAWNDVWSSSKERADWEEPAPEVVSLARMLGQGRDVRQVLYLGCGVGRHALMFARLGFAVTAVDMAEAGLAELNRNAVAEGLSIDAQVAPMTDLPFAEGAFDYVLAFNVIYHGDGEILRKTITEIRRVLRPGGIFQGTMLSKRHAQYGKGVEIASNTFIVEGGDGDKSHPHYYSNAADVVALFGGFELFQLQDKDDSGNRHWHWHLVAERLP